MTSLRMTGAELLLPTHASIAWTGRPLPLLLPVRSLKYLNWYRYLHLLVHPFLRICEGKHWQCWGWEGSRDSPPCFDLQVPHFVVLKSTHELEIIMSLQLTCVGRRGSVKEYFTEILTWGRKRTNAHTFMKIYYKRKGHAVAQLVEALRYKPQGRGFDSRLSHWDFSLT
jgi:hypothetical protein